MGKRAEKLAYVSGKTSVRTQQNFYTYENFLPYVRSETPMRMQ